MKSIFTKEYEHVLSRLIAARKNAGLTQDELAERLNKPQSFVSKYERGERRLDIVEFMNVALAIGIKPSTILAEIEDGYYAR